MKPVRTVVFSPAAKLLAAAGDSRVIALYDVLSGEQVANLAGHGAWILSLDWSSTGEAKVWSFDQRTCVATHAETDGTLWSVRWLRKVGKNEGFAVAGGNRSISFYREAAGA